MVKTPDFESGSGGSNPPPAAHLGVSRRRKDGRQKKHSNTSTDVVSNRESGGIEWYCSSVCDRVLACHARGHGFESRQYRTKWGW